MREVYCGFIKQKIYVGHAKILNSSLNLLKFKLVDELTGEEI